MTQVDDIHLAGRLGGVVFTGAAKLLAAAADRAANPGTCFATGRPRRFPREQWVWLESMVCGGGVAARFFGGESCEERAPEPKRAPPTITNYYDCAAGWAKS